MNKKTLGLAVGALALSAASMTMTGQASAETHSVWVGAVSSTQFSDGSIFGWLHTGSRVSVLATQVSAPHNLHHTQTQTYCYGQSSGWQIDQHVDPNETYLKTRIEYYCPGGNNLWITKGRLIDY